MSAHVKKLLLCTAICILPTSYASADTDTTVRSIDEVHGAINNRDARAAFDREMSGAPIPDGFGTQLPQGFTKDLLVAQLAPERDPARLVLAGAKPWPQHPGWYVAVVCLAPTPELAARSLTSARSSCDGFSDDPDNEIWLGVFNHSSGAIPHLIARTESPVAAPTDWGSTNIDAPQAIGSEDGKGPAEGLPDNWQRFDLAPYLLRDGDYAFGVRAGWSEGYAGGGASFESLYLFRIDGKSLRVVFSQPMLFNKMIAGDWHKDGTRSHDIYYGSNSLNVLPRMTAGFHDLQLREQRGKWRQAFRWSDSKQSYQTE
ncbi:MAG: hypothetical protein ABI171_06520 [Collimonas sp.]|uniref:hypothetical protein n=1 Tax=Collimonas sp. TaxID=1963772 RepID=UPI003263B391